MSAAASWAGLDRLGADQEGRALGRWLISGEAAPELRAGLEAFCASLSKKKDAELLGAAAVCLGRCEEGARLLAGAKSGPGLLWLAEARLLLGQAQAAAQALDRHLEKAPPAWKASCLLAIAQVRLGDSAQARRTLGALLEREPDCALAFALKGFLLDLPAGDARSALAELDRAAGLRPAAGWPLALRSQAHFSMGDTAACLADLNRAADLEPAGWILLLRSRLHRKNGTADAALADLRGALRSNPEQPALREELADLLFTMAVYEEAVAAYTQALAARSDDPIPLLEKRANCFWYMGRPDLALADLGRCLELAPGREHLRLRAARVALASGKRPFVKDCLERWGLEDRPEMEARSTFLRGLMSLVDRRYEDAVSSLSRSELLRKDAYFATEFPSLSYSNIARGLAYLESRRKS